MKYSIKILSTSMMILLFSFALFAQRGQKDFDPEKRADRMTAHLSEALELNEAQTEKVKAIHLKYGKQLHALKAKEGERSEKKEAIKQIKDDMKAEMKSVLTEEQFQQLEAMPKKGFRHKHRRKNPEHREQMKAFKEKAKPILLEQRVKLEPKISSEDQETLASIRAEIKQHKAERKAKMEERRAAFEKGERPSRKQMEERKAQREKNPNHIKIKELAEKYQADIEPLLAEVEPKMKALKEEMKKEMGSHPKSRNHHKRFENMSDEDKAKRDDKKQLRRYARFLLLDPNAAEETSILQEMQIRNVSIYPNPSQGISQIEYDLKAKGMVTIELRDKEGKLLEIIEQAVQAAGIQKTQVNLSNYSVGVYYIILKDTHGNAITEKVVR